MKNHFQTSGRQFTGLCLECFTNEVAAQRKTKRESVLDSYCSLFPWSSSSKGVTSGSQRPQALAFLPCNRVQKAPEADRLVVMVTSSLLEVSTCTCTELSVSLRKLLTWPVGKVTFVRRPKLSYLETKGVAISDRSMMVHVKVSFSSQTDTNLESPGKRKHQ